MTKQKMLRHDFYFKSLLSSLFPDFIQLFFPSMFSYLDVSSLIPMDKELLSDFNLQQTNAVDLIMKAKYKNQDSFFLIHVEIQSHPQADFPQRFFEYFILLYAKYRLPVYPIVVFSFDKPLKAQPSSYELRFSDVGVINFQYQCVQLNQLAWRDYLNVLNPVAPALMTRMNVARHERARVKLGCMALLKKLNPGKETTRLVSSFIDTYLKLTPREMEEYKQYRNELDPELREAVMELETSWKIEGREEGRLEGLQQGREEGKKEGLKFGMATLLEKQLSLRFGNLSQESLGKIYKLDPDQLLQLNEAVLSFKTSADFVHWLAEQT